MTELTQEESTEFTNKLLELVEARFNAHQVAAPLTSLGSMFTHISIEARFARKLIALFNQINDRIQEIQER